MYKNISILFVLQENPGSPTIAQIDIQATSMTIKWTAPVDDGGIPITAYRVVILKNGTEIKNVNITDSGTTSWNMRDLKRDTEYTVKLFARNTVFEGPAVEKAVKTKDEGNQKRHFDPRIFLLIRFLIEGGRGVGGGGG